MKQEQKSVRVVLCSEGLFWGADADTLNKVDEEASFDKFFDLVRSRVKRALSGFGFELTFEKGTYDKIFVDTQLLEEEEYVEDEIWDIMQRTHADDYDQWVVYKE